MFLQVFGGRVGDAEALHRQMDRWRDELMAGAEGFLGSTAGVTDEGEFVGLARFRDEEAARRNSGWAEQGAWWEETAKCFSGDIAFEDFPDAEVVLSGGSDAAGFVQVMRGRALDVARVRAIEDRLLPRTPELRPDLLGGVRGWHADGRFTEAAYFTSEAEARAGERRPVPDDLAAVFQEWDGLLEGVRYLDLRHPWMYSP